MTEHDYEAMTIARIQRPIRIDYAPKYLRMSLALVGSLDRECARINGDCIELFAINRYVTYQVDGYDASSASLLLHKIYDSQLPWKMYQSERIPFDDITAAEFQTLARKVADNSATAFELIRYKELQAEIAIHGEAIRHNEALEILKDQ